MGLCIWAFLWRARIKPYIDANPRAKVWLIATAATYLLSQLIARHALEHMLPDGSVPATYLRYMDGLMEETVENVAHAMLLVTVLVGRAPGASIRCSERGLGLQPKKQNHEWTRMDTNQNQARIRQRTRSTPITVIEAWRILFVCIRVHSWFS